MFCLSTKGIYGAQALIELSLRHGNGVVQIKELAESCQISKTYLEQLFNLLKKAEIVRSVRGNKGGYSLAREPEEISLMDVMVALEGCIEISKNVEVKGVLESVFKDTENGIRDSLSVSLKELADKEKVKNENVTFYI
ncbi:MAG: AsnC family transcriptional regulator [Planctomycetota bacterium]|nr:MAG: AsnC family transcriptional regulator [Planctomycetota bacterium]